MKEILETLHHELLERQKKEFIQRSLTFPKNSNEKAFAIIGIRRAGKTCFLHQIINKLLENGVSNEQILFLNFEDDRLLPCSKNELASLLEEFYSLYPKNHQRKVYIFLDEIQNVENWSSVVRRFIDTRDVEVYLCGSSAKLLSREIATSMRGRAFTLELFPYNVGELIKAKNKTLKINSKSPSTKDHLKKTLDSYLLEGGFPATTSLTNSERRQVLQSYVEIVTFRDIVERHNVQNLSLLNYLIKTLIFTSGNEFSANKFSKDAKSKGYRLSKDTVYDYIRYIEDTFLIFSVSIFNDSLRKKESNPKKIYCIDPGVVSAYKFQADKLKGPLFETAVFLELRRKGGEIAYYKTKSGFEIDFIHTSIEGQISAYQASYDISSKETKEREERAIDELKSELNLKGKIITKDNFFEEFYL